MERQEIGRFYATTYNKVTFEFIAYDDNTIALPLLGIDDMKRIELKPRFVLWGKDKYYTYNAKSENKKGAELIQNYDIDDELFDYLKQHGMIIYSTDMAYLYGFKDNDGYDKLNCAPSPYKWAKKKGPILIRQRNGQFN